MQRKIDAPEIGLSPPEQKIVEALIHKKDFSANEVVFEQAALNAIFLQDLRRKKDYNIKFILARTIQHLKEQFFRKMHESPETKGLPPHASKQLQDVLFYNHYFADIARRLELPIERFFAFKNWTHRYNRNIPKSITSQVISLWHMNPQFIRDIFWYLDHRFMADFETFNMVKIGNLIEKWARVVQKRGEEKGFQEVLGQLASKGCKVPWTVSEVRFALKETRQVLGG